MSTINLLFEGDFIIVKYVLVLLAVGLGLGIYFGTWASKHRPN